MVEQKGFTLIEMMIVVAIIGVLSAIAYPSYQNYVKKTKRTDMMTELTAMGGQVEAVKLAKGSYKTIQDNDTAKYSIAFPRSGVPLYNTSIEFVNQENNNNIIAGWTLTATPVSGNMMANDGVLSLDSKGVKCREPVGKPKQCGAGDEWRD